MLRSADAFGDVQKLGQKDLLEHSVGDQMQYIKEIKFCHYRRYSVNACCNALTICGEECRLVAMLFGWSLPQPQ